MRHGYFSRGGASGERGVSYVTPFLAVNLLGTKEIIVYVIVIVVIAAGALYARTTSRR